MKYNIRNQSGCVNESVRGDINLRAHLLRFPHEVKRREKTREYTLTARRFCVTVVYLQIVIFLFVLLLQYSDVLLPRYLTFFL